MMRLLSRATMVFVAVSFAACSLELRPEQATPDGGVSARPGVGAACTSDAGCRAGLVCPADRKTCQPPGNRPAGGGCVLSAECQTGLYCSPNAVCASSGSGAAGASCTLEGDCASGLLCSFQGLSGSCVAAGTADLGGACSKAADCMGGLICSLGKCESFDTIEPWLGAVCPDTSGDPAKVLFRVPRAATQTEDFYSLPFPNDIRKKDGKISLAGHPGPGARYLPIDPVGDYIALIEEEMVGFGVNQAVYFRLSREPNVVTTTASGAISLVNITPGSPEYGQTRTHVSKVETERNFYVCSPSLVVRPQWGSPLRAGETYAVVVRKTITDAAGTSFGSDDDFIAMLAASSPDEFELVAAWTAYAPLRAWIADKSVDGSQIAAAAVFTTQTLETPLVGLRRAVQEGAAPTVKNLVRCGAAGAVSPCDDGKTGSAHERGCFAEDPNAAYDEYQGTISIPIFQAGTKPYELPAAGGGIVLDGSGKAVVQGTEDVCFALTLPKGAAPAGGWPIVLYAHGTGGNYRAMVTQGLADEYARGVLADGAAIPMATISYDGVLHANRRGGSERSPDELVYNFVNARAARDNSLQGAADLFVMARALGNLSAGGSQINGSKIALYGHSQGGNAAALAMGQEPTFGAVVLSGTGGTLIWSLLGKKKPVDIAAVVPLLLGDPEVDEDHPVLNLLQMFSERSDPVNFGRRIFTEPPAGVPARHALHVFGTNDTFAPDETQRLFARAAGFQALAPVIDLHLPTSVSAPVTGNLGGITAVQAQYMPTGDDGHFVSTQNQNARRVVQKMLGTFLRDGTPTVGP